MITPELILIANDGRKITATNYWGTSLARAGAMLVSFNAGDARLLVPRVAHPVVAELTRNVKHVVISTGYWRAMGQPRCLEWLAEDESGNPAFVIVDADQTHGVSQIPRGKVQQMTASIWVEGSDGPEMRAEFPAYLRAVSELPCLREVA